MQVPLHDCNGLVLLEWNADSGRNIRRYATCDAIYQGRCHRRAELARLILKKKKKEIELILALILRRSPLMRHFQRGPVPSANNVIVRRGRVVYNDSATSRFEVPPRAEKSAAPAAVASAWPRNLILAIPPLHLPPFCCCCCCCSAHHLSCSGAAHPFISFTRHATRPWSAAACARYRCCCCSRCR